jgi:hypothetical protein
MVSVIYDLKFFGRAGVGKVFFFKKKFPPEIYIALINLKTVIYDLKFFGRGFGGSLFSKKGFPQGSQ